MYAFGLLAIGLVLGGAVGVAAVLFTGTGAGCPECSTILFGRKR